MKLKISPCLWFNDQAEAAAHFYTGIFPHSRITATSYYGEVGHEHHGRPPGSVMTVAFELNGQPFTALNGGPLFQFTEALSLQIECADQAEVDYYWDQLTAGGPPEAQVCGWLKDKYGLSWQVVPQMIPALMSGPATPATQRLMGAIMQMKKPDLATLQRAYDTP